MRNFKQKMLRRLLSWQIGGIRALGKKFHYQPAPWKPEGSDTSNTVRSSIDRLELLTPFLEDLEDRHHKTVLDIGSNCGYFLLRLAEKGFRVHGIERDPELVFYTNAAALVAQRKGVSCECASLDDDFLARKTPYDIVLNFSVMHHVMMHQGIEVATRLMSGLAEQTRIEMYFEMGTSDEDVYWAKKLPEMKPKPETWIADWLSRCGFSSVEQIGESLTTAGRPIFRCRK